ncbi:tetratricopeptide repeat protein [Nocardia salmonicida]
MNYVGDLSHRGNEGNEAESWWRQAADKGHVKAMVSVGNLHLKRGEFDEAEHWYRKAADAGDSSAVVSLGNLTKDWGKVPKSSVPPP